MVLDARARGVAALVELAFAEIRLDLLWAVEVSDTDSGLIPSAARPERAARKPVASAKRPGKGTGPKPLIRKSRPEHN